MQFKELGQSGVTVSQIAFGAWAIGGWMWGGTDADLAIDAMEQAVEMGITTIDTAPVYGFGLSEELVGKVTKNKRDRVQILTKCGLRWDVTKGQFHFSSFDNKGKAVDIYKYSAADSIIYECEQSLIRLQTDYIDLYQVHWPDETTAVEETMEALDKLIQQGKVRAAGVSNYPLAWMEKASQHIVLASNQMPYSMVNRKIEQDVVPYCIKNNIAIIAYSPMQRGLLTGKINTGSIFNKGDNRPSTPFFSPENIIKTNEFLTKIQPIADKYNITMAQLVLNWTRLQPGISCVLAGARTAQQVKENAYITDIALEDILFINVQINNYFPLV